MKTLIINFILFNTLCIGILNSQTAPKVFNSNADAADYSKLKSYLFQNGVLYRSGELSYPEFKGTYINHIDESMLTKLFTFVKNGGRAWVYISESDQRFNDRLQELFEISIAKEQVTQNKYASSVSGNSLFKLWNGLRIAARPKEFNGIDSYLVLLNQATWSTTSIVSEQTGKSRILSAHKKFGNGEIVFMCGYYWSFLSDDAIELMDNYKAVINLMFQWLSQKIEY